MTEETFERSRALLGDAAFARLNVLHVAVFGVGGVGSWCAEALLRTGVRRLTLIDDDDVAPSNINRQRQARPDTIGRPKVEVLRDQLLKIVPDAQIMARTERYTPQNAAAFDDLFAESDIIIDAIDSVESKAHLMRRCADPVTSVGRAAPARRPPPLLFSSLGAALRTDPTCIRVAPFHKVAGDGLARALRNRFRKAGITLPRHLCVYSEEPPKKLDGTLKGSIMPVTCAFGMTLASLVIHQIAHMT